MYNKFFERAVGGVLGQQGMDFQVSADWPLCP